MLMSANNNIDDCYFCEALRTAHFTVWNTELCRV